MLGLEKLHHRRVHLPRTARVAEALTALLAPSAPSTILDVGAGDGRIGASVARALGAELEAIELEGRAGAAPGYDGERLPFADGAFEAVLVSDVLHHARSPRALLAECLRVSPLIAVKDHFGFGPWSRKLLRAMDAIGNGVDLHVSGYLSPPEWIALVEAAGARVRALHWPLRVHDLPFRLVTRSELQFAALLERRR